MDRINTAVRAGPPVNDLVTRAGNGDKQAWDTLVERYAPLIWSICRRLLAVCQTPSTSPASRPKCPSKSC